MKKIILIDLDNTLIDFNECARHSIINIFNDLGFYYDENVFKTFITENVRIWKRLEVGEIDKAFLRANRWNIILGKLGIDYDGTMACVWADGYITNLGLCHAGLCQGKFLVDGDMWLDICRRYDVVVEWCNR